MKFSIKDFFSKCDQIRRNLRIWSHLLKKSLKWKTSFFVQWELTKVISKVQEKSMSREGASDFDQC